MKTYHYQKIEKYNRCILVVEYAFDGVIYTGCSVYPVARLTHYRYLLNHRLSRISDWVDEQVKAGVPINRIPMEIAIGTETDDYARHIFINYGDTYANIMENEDSYYYNDNGVAFRIAGLGDREPNRCIYKIKSDDQDWLQIRVPNKMSLNRLKSTRAGRFHQLLHMFE